MSCCCCCCTKRNNFIIRNPKSNLVLDAKGNIVKLQHYNECATQLWQFEEFVPGKYLIVNKSNGEALDIEGGSGHGKTLITYPKHGRINQLWWIHDDNTIGNVGGNLVVDIFGKIYNTGNRLIAFEKHGKDNQKFYIQCT